MTDTDAPLATETGAVGTSGISFVGIRRFTVDYCRVGSTSCRP